MNATVRPFRTQKRGNAQNENDDASHPSNAEECSLANVKVAIADGATESVFAGRWARRLVSAFVEGEIRIDSLLADIARLCADWEQWISAEPLPWFAEEKARQGTFASLLGLELYDGDDSQSTFGRWRAIAVGDSCIFHLRDKEIVNRFPIACSGDFSNRPHLLGTILSSNRLDCEHRIDGDWQRGDRFLLMTDALACWFLRHLESGGSPLDVPAVEDLQHTGEMFEKWINDLRDHSAIHNDDCTFVILTLT